MEASRARKMHLKGLRRISRCGNLQSKFAFEAKMTRKMNFFIRKLQFQRTIPGSLENLNCLTLSDSKISEGVGFCTQENGKSCMSCRSKVCFSTLEKTLYISSTFPKLVLFCNSGSLLCFPPSHGQKFKTCAG